jgi:hypothetical protein
MGRVKFYFFTFILIAFFFCLRKFCNWTLVLLSWNECLEMVLLVLCGELCAKVWNLGFYGNEDFWFIYEFEDVWVEWLMACVKFDYLCS